VGDASSISGLAVKQARRVVDSVRAAGGQARDGLSASLAEVTICPQLSSRSQCNPLSGSSQAGKKHDVMFWVAA